jgi:hypothetical protein
LSVAKKYNMEALQIDGKTLLHNAAQMPVPELERFLREANALLFRKKTKDKKLRERQLLYKINSAILDSFQIERYHLLSEKLHLGTIEDIEQFELEGLANQEEKLRNQRVKYMIELSQIRETTLLQLMESLDLTPIARA